MSSRTIEIAHNSLYGRVYITRNWRISFVPKNSKQSYFDFTLLFQLASDLGTRNGFCESWDQAFSLPLFNRRSLIENAELNMWIPVERCESPLNLSTWNFEPRNATTLRNLYNIRDN